ncbi:MAG TPA: glutathione peroxidase [Gemmatales bacterium]|nr:glutathione peroxidase [Gemmatales bacterium]HMP57982.1 glutathione peroxidase [Gemmatales bacterium]
MRRILVVSLACAALGACALPTAAESKETPPVLNFTMKTIDGKDLKLSQFQGKVVLFVNVASKCGLTPQYQALQDLHDKYADQGLVIIGIPANDFGRQEPGSDSEIAEFCTNKFGVKFQMMSKVVVKGDGQCELYKFLTSKESNPQFAGDITWNFEKFLVNRKGEVVQRFNPRVKPDDPRVLKAIEDELAQK